jgi:hypothetical protein
MGNGFPFSRKTKILPAARTKVLSRKASYNDIQAHPGVHQWHTAIRGLLAFLERERGRERGMLPLPR